MTYFISWIKATRNDKVLFVGYYDEGLIWSGWYDRDKLGDAKRTLLAGEQKEVKCYRGKDIALITQAHNDDGQVMIVLDSLDDVDSIDDVKKLYPELFL